MSEDLIHLSLSRADAELIADLADTGLDRETSFPSMDGFTPAYRAELDRLREDGQRVIKLIYAALAAPAEGPGPTRKRLADIAEAIWNGPRWHTGEEGDFIEDATEILCGHFGVAEGPERAAGFPLPPVNLPLSGREASIVSDLFTASLGWTDGPQDEEEDVRRLYDRLQALRFPTIGGGGEGEGT